MADGAVDFEDDQALLLKDRATRRRYLKWFNKRRADFSTDREYDDYLEMVEDTIYKVVHGIDVPATRAKVDAYRRANADTIAANQALRVDEERAAAEEVAQSARDRTARLMKVRREDDERERAAAARRRVQEAEELVRAAHGEEEYRRVVRRREKRERKARKKEESEKAPAAPDTQPQWFRPNFPSALPAVIPGSGSAEDPHKRPLPEDDSEEAAAGGFSLTDVRQRALLEFEESFALLLDLE